MSETTLKQLGKALFDISREISGAELSLIDLYKTTNAGKNMAGKRCATRNSNAPAGDRPFRTPHAATHISNTLSRNIKRKGGIEYAAFARKHTHTSTTAFHTRTPTKHFHTRCNICAMACDSAILGKLQRCKAPVSVASRKIHFPPCTSKNLLRLLRLSSGCWIPAPPPSGDEAYSSNTYSSPLNERLSYWIVSIHPDGFPGVTSCQRERVLGREHIHIFVSTDNYI